MRTMYSAIRRISLVSFILVGLLSSWGIQIASAQTFPPPILSPAPGSTLTSSMVTFTGDHTSQDLEHTLWVGTRLRGTDLSKQKLGMGHTATVSGLPTTGTIFVSWWTRNNVGWFVKDYTYTMDVGGGSPRVWNCPGGDVNCLINALTIGNGSGNLEIIQLAAGTYTIASFDNGSNLLPRIIGNIKIEGVGSQSTVIRGMTDANVDFFQTFEVDALGTLELTKLAIMKGGTGVRNRGGSVTMREVTISDNTINGLGGRGGPGIINDQGGTITIQDSTVADYNEGVPGAGGGISNSGTMDITGSFIKRNRGEGMGGIANGSTGIMTINTSTIADNRAGDGDGGGIINAGQMELRNSLVQNNSADIVAGLVNRGDITIFKSVFIGNVSGTGVSGGAIFNAGPMTISQSVIAFNKAGDDGGGIFNRDDGDLTLEQTVIFKNEAVTNGGGIKNINGLLTLTETIVINNTPDDCVGCP